MRNAATKARKKPEEDKKFITTQVKLLPTPEQALYLKETTKEFISAVNMLVEQMTETGNMKITSAGYTAKLNSSVKNEAINAAKSVILKHRKGITKTLAVLKKPAASWNNQNYSFDVDAGWVSFPVLVGGKSTKIRVSAIFDEYQTKQLEAKLGSLRITQKNGKWIAQFAVCVPEFSPKGEITMGIDLGIKVPAVAVTDTGKTKFFGNGRLNKRMKRKYRAKRRALGKAKKPHVIKRLSNKEQRWMQDVDHKVSRSIVNYAVESNVAVIKLERLANIRNTARISRKNNRSLHSWSFYRLSQFIEYKAYQAGIRVEYVNPAYTSQTCPNCGTRNHADDRDYRCKCGFHAHRDRVGAINITNALWLLVKGNQPKMLYALS